MDSTNNNNSSSSTSSNTHPNQFGGPHSAPTHTSNTNQQQPTHHGQQIQQQAVYHGQTPYAQQYNAALSFNQQGQHLHLYPNVANAHQQQQQQQPNQNTQTNIPPYPAMNTMSNMNNMMNNFNNMNNMNSMSPYTHTFNPNQRMSYPPTNHNPYFPNHHPMATAAYPHSHNIMHASSSSVASMHTQMSSTRMKPRSNIIVNDNDVLSGRGVNIAQHVGNQRFRTLITTFRDQEYCTSYSAGEKRAVAIQIIKQLKSLDPPGRFLKRDGRGQGSRGLGGPWEELSEREAIKKTCQALRDCNRQDRQGYAKGVTTPGDILGIVEEANHVPAKERAAAAAHAIANEATSNALRAIGVSPKNNIKMDSGAFDDSTHPHTVAAPLPSHYTKDNCLSSSDTPLEDAVHTNQINNDDNIKNTTNNIQEINTGNGNTNFNPDNNHHSSNDNHDNAASPSSYYSQQQQFQSHNMQNSTMINNYHNNNNMAAANPQSSGFNFPPHSHMNMPYHQGLSPQQQYHHNPYTQYPMNMSYPSAGGGLKPNFGFGGGSAGPSVGSYYFNNNPTNSTTDYNNINMFPNVAGNVAQNGMPSYQDGMLSASFMKPNQPFQQQPPQQQPQSQQHHSMTYNDSNINMINNMNMYHGDNNTHQQNVYSNNNHHHQIIQKQRTEDTEASTGPSEPSPVNGIVVNRVNGVENNNENGVKMESPGKGTNVCIGESNDGDFNQLEKQDSDQYYDAQTGGF